MTETPKGSNRGDWVDRFNQFCKMVKVPWCGSVQAYLSESGKIINPRIHSARARDYSKGGYSINDIQFGMYTPKPGDYRVKRRRGGNHVDIFLSWDKDLLQGYVIGGNVSDAVSIRKVTLRSMIADGTTHITSVTGCYDYTLPDNDFTKWLAQFGGLKIETKPYTSVMNEEIQIHGTYYSSRFQGRKTAPGIRYDSTKLTAAHKTLKLGTKILVTNPLNGKKVVVEINDRCPKRGILDLSKAAADSIKISSGKVQMLILE